MSFPCPCRPHFHVIAVPMVFPFPCPCFHVIPISVFFPFLCHVSSLYPHRPCFHVIPFSTCPSFLFPRHPHVHVILIPTSMSFLFPRYLHAHVILISTSSPCPRHSYSHASCRLSPTVTWLHVVMFMTTTGTTPGVRLSWRIFGRRDGERRLTGGKCLLLLLESVHFFFCVLPWEVRGVSVSLRWWCYHTAVKDSQLQVTTDVTVMNWQSVVLILMFCFCVPCRALLCFIGRYELVKCL